MTRFAVDIADVEQASALVGASSAAISTEVHNMMTHLQSLAGTWQGGASAQFQEAAARWRVTQAQVEENLQAINQALGQSAAIYAQAESAVHTNFAF